MWKVSHFKGLSSGFLADFSDIRFSTQRILEACREPKPDKLSKLEISSEETIFIFIRPKQLERCYGKN